MHFNGGGKKGSIKYFKKYKRKKKLKHTFPEWCDRFDLLLNKKHKVCSWILIKKEII